MASRPKPVAAGDVRGRVNRGPRDDGRWYWRFDSADGAGGRTAHGAVWATTAEAREHAVRLAVEVARDEGAIASEVSTVADLLEVWLGSAPPPSPRTALFRVGAARRLLPVLGAVRLDAPPVVLLDALRTYADGAGAASTRDADLSILGAAWRWGLTMDLVRRPLPRVAAPTGPAVYTRYTPPPERLGEIVAAVEGAASPRVARAVLLLAATGARLGEILGLAWTDIGEGTVTVRGKTGARAIPLGAAVARRVATWPREGTGPCDEGSRGAIRRALLTAGAALGLDGRLSPHGLRRCAVDALYTSGARPEVAAAILGHSPETALRHYRTVGAEAAREALAATAMGALSEGDASEGDDDG